MDITEIKLRCIEAAAKNPTPHSEGYGVGARESAKLWFDWIISSAGPSAPIKQDTATDVKGLL